MELQGYQRNTSGIALEDEELQSDAAVNHGPENRSFLSDFNDELSSLAFFRRLQNLQVWFIQEPEILQNMVCTIQSFLPFITT